MNQLIPAGSSTFKITKIFYLSGHNLSKSILKLLSCNHFLVTGVNGRIRQLLLHDHFLSVFMFARDYAMWIERLENSVFNKGEKKKLSKFTLSQFINQTINFHFLLYWFYRLRNWANWIGCRDFHSKNELLVSFVKRKLPFWFFVKRVTVIRDSIVPVNHKFLSNRNLI